MSAQVHIAQFNWGLLRHDWEDPRSAGFTENLDRVNAIAERSAGFVWRMLGDEMDPQLAVVKDAVWQHPRLAATLSVWEGAKALSAFVHDTIHGSFVKRREEWFDPAEAPRYVLWDVPAGHRPDIHEALARLTQLTTDGPSGAAYDFDWLRQQSMAAE